MEKEKNQNLYEALSFVSDSLRPFGRPQERVFNLFYYLNLYGGMPFIDWLYDNYSDNIDLLEVTNA